MKRPRSIKKKSGLLNGARNHSFGCEKAPKSLKPQKARSLIRRFHVLQKDRHAVLLKLKLIFPDIDGENYKQLLGNDYEISLASQSASGALHKSVHGISSKAELVEALALIDAEIASRGGISTYQAASTQGQSKERGGDSSKKLVEWLADYKWRRAPRALEIGCLSPSNAISKSSVFDTVTRIDLNSQHPSILKQDFMKRPLSDDDADLFEVISCSLVLNFVPSPAERGSMLARIAKFMSGTSSSACPRLLFIVLPLPCVSNLRYMDRERFEQICASLGFVTRQYYDATKVAYWLMELLGKPLGIAFPKQKVADGPKHNNFSITLTGEELD